MIYVLVLCVCVCDTVHVFTQQEIGLLWEVSELVKVPTVLSSFLNQKQLFHKAVYLMSLTTHC